MKITEVANKITIKSDSDEVVGEVGSNSLSINYAELLKILKEIDTRLKALESK